MLSRMVVSAGKPLSLRGAIVSAARWRGLAEDAAAAPAAANSPSESSRPVSYAMRDYLARKQRVDQFMAAERDAFELGRAHLASMMGVDLETMTQEEIDKAVAYLLPSGLTDKSARPLMKPPEEVRYKRIHLFLILKDSSKTPHTKMMCL